MNARLDRLPWNEATVLGATGLVGREAVRLLLDGGVERVHTIVRRPSGVVHSALAEHVADFERKDEWAAHVQGELFFSALGTTIKTAGSQAAQFRVDHDYQLWGAEAARKNGVPTTVLVSALGASPKSRLFYSRIKGELEERVEALGFPRLRVLRPGMLDGERAEKRTGERLLLPVLRTMPKWAFLASARPIPVAAVARAGLRAALEPNPGAWFLEPNDLFARAEP